MEFSWLQSAFSPLDGTKPCTPLCMIYWPLSSQMEKWISMSLCWCWILHIAKNTSGVSYLHHQTRWIVSSSPLSCSCEEEHTLHQITSTQDKVASPHSPDIQCRWVLLGGGWGVGVGGKRGNKAIICHVQQFYGQQQVTMNVWIVLVGLRSHKRPPAGGTELDTGLPSTVSRAHLAKCMEEASDNSSQL